MSKFLKYGLIGLGIFVAFIIFLNIVIPKPKITDTSDFEKQIEDLKNANIELVKKQIDLDSLNAQYEQRITDIESRLEDVGTSRVIIQKIYNDKITKSKSATPSDVDSFFKQRYNY